MKQLLFTFLLIPFAVSSQTARFYVDTLNEINRGRERSISEEIKEMTWRIKGKTIDYKSGAVEIPLNPKKLDTLFYKQRPDSKWDTIVFLARNSGDYQFVYNHCCGGFDIADKNGDRFRTELQFNLVGKPKRKTFLGTLGDDGIIVTNNTEILREGCHSPMLPNIYYIRFNEIEACKDTLKCREEVCLFRNGKSETDYGFSFRTIKSRLSVLYMPLDNKPVKITYDVRKEELNFE